MNENKLVVLQIVVTALMAGLSTWVATQKTVSILDVRIGAIEKKVELSTVNNAVILERLMKVEGEDRIINLKIEYLEGRIDNIIITRESE